jgi:hypothetical protein
VTVRTGRISAAGGACSLQPTSKANAKKKKAGADLIANLVLIHRRKVS